MSNKISNLQKILSSSTTGKENIRGKEYSTVPLRVEVFRREFERADIDSLCSIFTRLDVFEDRVVARSYLAEEVDIIINEDGNEIVQMKGVKSVGTAEEYRDASSVNKTSAVENAETSAAGRMLGLLGLHGGQMASVEEIGFAKSAEKVVELRPKNKKAEVAMTAEEFAKRAKACTTKVELNELLIQERDFFEGLKSKSETEYQDLRSAMQKLRDALPVHGKES